MSKSHLEEDELADIMAMFPDVDFAYDQDGQLIIYTGRYLKEDTDDISPMEAKENE